MISAADTQLLTHFFGKNCQIADRPAADLHRFFTINNPDGTARWVFPEGCRAETLLALYNGGGWRGRIFSNLLRAAFVLKKTNWLAADQFWAKLPADDDPDFAIFTGTVGLNRKLVVSAAAGSFEKIPTTPDAAQLTDAEFLNLQQLENLHLEKAVTPRATKTERGGIRQNSVRPSKTKACSLLLPQHRAVLVEISSKTRRSMPIHDTSFFKKILENLAQFDACQANEFTRRAAPLRHSLEILLSKMDADVLRSVSLAHGDFTPWNCFLPANRAAPLAIYDWELALSDAPTGFDALHFVVQSGVLLRRVPPRKLLAEARAEASTDLLGWYVLFTAAYYLPKYAQQEHLHRQVWWLLEFWDMLLSEVFRLVGRH